MSKKGKKSFNAQQYGNRQIELRTYAALKEKNARFAAEHAQDTDEQLLSYLQRSARELGQTPNPEELIGGAYIAGRFGGYARAVQSAGLPAPGPLPSPMSRRLFREEFKLQASIYRKEKTAARAKKAAEQQARTRAAREERDARLARDMAWGEEHQNDSAEELAAYLRACAQALGHSPFSREVVGGRYIAKRLGSWAMALYLADLPMAQGMIPPTPGEIAAFRARQKRG